MKLLPKLLTILLAISIGSSNVAMAVPEYFPFGPQTNVEISQIADGGWTKCHSDFYGDLLPTFAEIKAKCQGNLILYAAGDVGSDNYLLIAAGSRNVVFRETSYLRNQVVTSPDTQYSNGSYWYGQDSESTGFSGNPVIRLNTADTCKAAGFPVCNATDDGSLRLSWHGQGSGGGWRIGNTIWLNDSFDHIREIWVSNGNPATPLYIEEETKMTISKNSITCLPGTYGVGKSEVAINALIYRLYVNDVLNSTLAYDPEAKISPNLLSSEVNALPAALTAKSVTWDISSLKDYSIRCEVTAVGFNSSIASSTSVYYDAEYKTRESAAAQAWEAQRSTATAANFTKDMREMRKRIAARQP